MSDDIDLGDGMKLTNVVGLGKPRRDQLIALLLAERERFRAAGLPQVMIELTLDGRAEYGDLVYVVREAGDG
ncbi:MAG TPA: hypothetical protein VF526_15475 [Solirubrobacteraceae bacterium]|jgi:hypothetical protein